MRFTKENCLGDDYGKAFAMALLDKSGLVSVSNGSVDSWTFAIDNTITLYHHTITLHHNEIYSDITYINESINIKFKTLFDLFSDPLAPTQEECTMFSLEFGAEYIIKPTQQ